MTVSRLFYSENLGCMLVTLLRPARPGTPAVTDLELTSRFACRFACAAEAWTEIVRVWGPGIQCLSCTRDVKRRAPSALLETKPCGLTITGVGGFCKLCERLDDKSLITKVFKALQERHPGLCQADWPGPAGKA